MSDELPVMPDEWMADSIGRPIIDLLHFENDTDSYAVTFVPHDDVSSEEKEYVHIPADSADGRQIAHWMTKLAGLIAKNRKIELIIHGGGDNFTIRFTDGTAYELTRGESRQSGVEAAVYHALQYLALTAETAFRIAALSTH